MKILHTGTIVLDSLDILCLSVSSGSLVAYGFKRYRKYKIIKSRGEDKIVQELKKKSSRNIVSQKGNLLKVPLMRGGDNIPIRGVSGMVKNKKLAKIVMAIVNAKKNQKKLRLLQNVLLILNRLLTDSTGFRIAVGGSLDYVQVILIALPATIGGFILGSINAYPVASTLVPIAIIFGRGIENIQNPYERCRLICKTAEEFHNQKLMVQMEKLDLLVDATELQLPVDKVSLLCDEQPFSLLERYKLREVIKSAKARERVQHFSEFMKKFPECDADPKAVYEEVIGNVKKIPMKGS
jgi:hypothetical protein